MPGAIVENVHGGFLPSNLPDATCSASAALFKGSNTTLADDDLHKDLTYKSQKHAWLDRLLKIFCTKSSKQNHTIMGQGSVQPRPETYANSSPWLLPVYVLSTRRDKDKHHVAMEAKCTIDTGNMQGNIVSRRFVEDVLEYPESAFCSLTKEEEAGATGITGHQLIPEAAVYLTWYHRKSTRVFRDMRFLISPSQHFDLIIGAESIHRDKLLDVPNLTSQLPDIVTVENLGPDDSAEAIFSAMERNIDGRIKSYLPKIRDLERDVGEYGAADLREESDKIKDAKRHAANKAANLREKREDLKRDFEILQKNGHEILSNSGSPAEKKAAMNSLKERLYAPPPTYEKVAPETKTDSPHNLGIENKSSGQATANQNVKTKN
ncbi:hypothetical protein B0O99DRAFT_683495 [Bisporella sp. PMI_857]|nr:hypothetical protein B0O99DRAFT_683495 [Bisporella sp. PMI_857]